MIFRSRPYFMASKGLYLSPWTLDFNPKQEIIVAPVWVRLPHLLLILWDDSTLGVIGNKLGQYIDHVKPKGNLYYSVRTCMEVDLGKGLPESLQINFDGWSHCYPPFCTGVAHVFVITWIRDLQGGCRCYKILAN
jgi:hypothetical protein